MNFILKGVVIALTTIINYIFVAVYAIINSFAMLTLILKIVAIALAPIINYIFALGAVYAINYLDSMNLNYSPNILKIAILNSKCAS